MSPNDGNNRVIDPTENVLNLVEAAVSRLNDLRDMDNNWRGKLDAVHAVHNKELRRAESERIDAIRAVDVGAVAAAASAAETRANALAAQVAASAEAMRTQVAAAASAAAAALTAALDPIQKDIADLRRVQYEGVGMKTQVVEARANTGLLIAAAAAAVALVIGLLTYTVLRTPAGQAPVVRVCVPTATATCP